MQLVLNGFLEHFSRHSVRGKLVLGIFLLLTCQSTLWRSFQENGSICIFLELVKMGSLQSIMKNFQVFDEVLMSSYTRQILAGLEYLHSMNTIHR